ncbi:MAG: hypothetical protein DCC75_01705 [Proteobacteria bacterium]|nr:MAG: hypothetical protein DCC75_01705 [Pseudomonadota bacterium]
MNEDVGAAKLIFSTLGLGIMLLLFHSALRAEQMAWVCSSDAPVKVEHKDGRRILGKSDWSAKQIRRRLKRIKRSGGNGAAHKERRILTRLLRKLAACSDLKSTPAPSPAPTPASCSTALHLPVCGDGICSGAETFADCENDCRGSCGDGSCNLITEDHFSCVQDCTGSYFVVDLSSPACSDSGPGTLAQPFCTIRSSATKLGPGVTVYLRNGKQSFGGFVRFDKAGLPGRLITFRNFPGESPVIDAGEALPLAGSWQEVAATAGGRYKFYTADTSLGAFDSAAQGGEGNYPHSLLQEGRAPLSRLLSEADIYNVLAVDQISEFEAYFIDCGSGRVLLRLFAESPPPDSVPVVSATNNRWVLAASFIQPAWGSRITSHTRILKTGSGSRTTASRSWDRPSFTATMPIPHRSACRLIQLPPGVIVPIFGSMLSMEARAGRTSPLIRLIWMVPVMP